MDEGEKEKQVRRLRHSIRGSVNAIKLGITVLEIGLPADEAAEFLTYIEDAAGSLGAQLDEYEAAIGDGPPAPEAGGI
jgi:hypothetical protein